MAPRVSRKKATEEAREAPARLPGQGERTKRTPTSAFDGAAGKDTYEPEKIVAKRQAKGETQWLVKWKGYENRDNTWEPLEHLAGCEDMIVEFHERERTRLAQVEAAAEVVRAEKEAEAAQKAVEMAAAAAEARSAARKAAEEAGDDPGAVDRAGDVAQMNAELLTGSGKKNAAGQKRSSWAWAAFDDKGCEAGKACCVLIKDDGNLCGTMIVCHSGPTGMKNHILHKHPREYIKMAPPTEALNVKMETLPSVVALPAKQREELHKAHARWLCKRKRPFSLPEDEEYKFIWKLALKGAYTPPDHKLVLAQVFGLAQEGKKCLLDANTALRKAGIKPAMAGDIWSDRGVSLLGLCEYFMTDTWEIKQMVLAATPFTERHTGVAIDRKTRDACIEAGLSSDVFSTVFFPVSDNASNMKNGWASFGRGPCCVHSVQLSVHVYLNHPRIIEMRAKEHGIVAHFSHSTGIDGLGALQSCQRECNLPVHHPVKDVNTRWSSGHDQMEWFRVQQRAIQLYDINHARKAGEAYRTHQMGVEDWRLSMESVAVLQPLADWTQHMQGTKYPTLPLVLPTLYGLIRGMAPDAPLVLKFPETPTISYDPEDIHPEVLAARTRLYNDMVERWITELDHEVKRTYAIATMLHPCFKSYDFIEDFDLIPASDKSWALRELRAEWLTVWKPRPAPVLDLGTTPASSSSATSFVTTESIEVGSKELADAKGTEVNPLLKKRKVSLGSLLGPRVKKAAPQLAALEFDELDEYLADPEEPDLDIDVLVWWRAKEYQWPALAKMVKQYFSAPASSAGVERIFSAAGKMHGDLQKSAKDSTLENSLFAAFNTD